MDGFVKKQLAHIGFTEDSHSDIWFALRELNEADFRGLTVQKLRHFFPNRLDVQNEIIHHVEVLRANNAALGANHSYGSSQSGMVEGNQATGCNSLVSVKTEVKPEPVNYSSDSDIEILSSDEDTEPTVNSNQSDDDSDGSVILESVVPRCRRRKKRAHLISLNTAASSEIGQEKVPRTVEANGNLTQDSSSTANQYGTRVIDSEPEASAASTPLLDLNPKNTDKIPDSRDGKGITVDDNTRPIHLMSPNAAASPVIPEEEIPRTIEVNLTEKNPSQAESKDDESSAPGPSSAQIFRDTRNTDSIARVRVRSNLTVEKSSSSIDHTISKVRRSVQPKPIKTQTDRLSKKSTTNADADMTEESLENIPPRDEKLVPTYVTYEVHKQDPVNTVEPYTCVSDKFILSLLEIVERKEMLPTGRKYSIHPYLTEGILTLFYDHLGKYIHNLALCSWSWRNPDGSILSSPRKEWWAKDLGKILYVLCPNLQVLSLQVMPNTTYDETQINLGELIQPLPNLKEVFLTNCSNEVLSQLEIILKAGKSIWKVVFAVDEINKMTGILNLIQNLSTNNFLQQLTVLCVRISKNHWDTLFLTSAHFMTLSRCNFPKLRQLEIDCNFSEECKESIETVLQKFSDSLEYFDCKGSFFGSGEDSTFTMVVPKMDRLRYFCFGYNYTLAGIHARNCFKEYCEDEAESEPGNQGSNVGDHPEQHHMLKFGLNMCHIYPSMVVLRSGSLCIPEDMHFFNFPNLTTFEAGGPWDTTIKFPSSTSRHSNYPKLTSIKLSERIENERILLDLPRVFPNLTKVSIKFPTARCLKKFFKLMVDSRLAELDLQTDFCFSWTLTEILIGKGHAGGREQSEVKMAEKLKNYSDFKEFVRLYKVDFPFDMLDPNDLDFEPNEESNDVVKRIEFLNRQLKVFNIKHHGRQLDIPKGNVSFKDPRCEYFDEKIGFLADYPLDTHNLITGFRKTRDEGVSNTLDYQYQVANIILS